MIIDGNVLTPDTGKLLTNGKVTSDKVYLGIHDSPDNWYEIPADGQEEIPDNEALDILTGRDTDEPENSETVTESN